MWHFWSPGRFLAALLTGFGFALMASGLWLQVLAPTQMVPLVLGGAGVPLGVWLLMLFSALNLLAVFQFFIKT